MLNCAPTINPLSKWKQLYDLKNDQKFENFLSEFFLRRKSLPELYAKAIELSNLSETEKIQKGFRPEKTFPEPIDQLSPKGLAIMSYLYAQKDKTDKQPLIASTTHAFKRLIRLIDRASLGTEVTVILQPTDDTRPTHKIVSKIKKTAANIQIVYMDATNNPNPAISASHWALYTLQEHALRTEKTPTPLLFGIQKNHPSAKGKPFSRLTNGYECGTIAIKDARQMNRDSHFVSNIIQGKNKHTPADMDVTEDSNTGDSSNLYYYDVPPDYLKGIQSDTYAKEMLRIHGHQVVTLTGKEPAPRTLEQTYAKHRDQYVQHFSQKFYDAVETFVKENRDKIEHIKEVTRHYDAEKITLEELERRYGPPGEELKTRAEEITTTVVPSQTQNMAQDTPPAPSTPTNDIETGQEQNKTTDGAPLLRFTPATQPAPQAKPRKSCCCSFANLKSWVPKIFS